MKAINIKGKEYVMVHERILHFRDKFEGYYFTTDFVELTEDRCVMKCSVFNEQGVEVSTGHAYEMQDSTFINKTSYVENCETSAIGRALGNLGIGIDTGIASFEEVANAITQQEDKRPWLSEKAYNKALERIKNKDWGKDKEGNELSEDQFKNNLFNGMRMKKHYRQMLEAEFENPINNLPY